MALSHEPTHQRAERPWRSRFALEQKPMRQSLANGLGLTPTRSATAVVSMYIGIIGAAEAATAFWGATPGLLCHSALLLALLHHYLLVRLSPQSQPNDPNAIYWSADVILALALLPLLRIVNLSLPLGNVSLIHRYAIVGFVLLVAIGLVLRALDLSMSKVGLRWEASAVQFIIGTSGLLLTVAAYHIWDLRPVAEVLSWREWMINAFILLILVGFTEELLFRGLLQPLLVEVFGDAGVVWGTVLFMLMYLGHHSISYLIFAGVVGLIFSSCARWTGSIWGVVVAHGLLAVGLVIGWPPI